MDKASKLAFACVLAICALLSACAPQLDDDPFGRQDAEAELSLIIDDTLEGQWANDGAFFAGGKPGEGNLANITFRDPVFCNADGDAASYEELAGCYGDPGVERTADPAVCVKAFFVCLYIKLSF